MERSLEDTHAYHRDDAIIPAAPPRPF